MYTKMRASLFQGYNPLIARQVACNLRRGFTTKLTSLLNPEVEPRCGYTISLRTKTTSGQDKGGKDCGKDKGPDAKIEQKPPEKEKDCKPKKEEKKDCQPPKPPPPKKEQQLPKLPVPPMHRTLMHNYLMSVRPFLTCEEFCTTEEIVMRFEAPGGIGEYLHNELVERAKREDNWLKEWWLNAAYLDFRAPVVVFSSPAEVFPKQCVKTEDDYLTLVTNIIVGALEFKTKIDNNEVPVEKVGNDELDMVQYKRIYGTSRSPCCPRDRLMFYPDAKHIIIMCHNEFFKVNIVKDGTWLPPSIIKRQIDEVILNSSKNCEPPVGALTSDSRDNWSSAYSLLYQDAANKVMLQEIEQSLFVVCLDMIPPPKDLSDMNTSGMMVLHGGGPCYNGNNRWYDKTLQLIVGRDGSCGICYEHSPAEAGPVAAITDHIVEKIQSGCKIDKMCDDLEACFKPKKLCFNINCDVKATIDQAQSNLGALVNDLQLNCFSFCDFGKDTLKELKVSPDSFIQLAIQYSYVRMYNEPGAQYESASLRKFKEGRTETIRTASSVAIRSIQALRDACLPVKSKANALRLALNAHKNLTTAAMNGQGVDRYLLGLRMAAKEKNMPEPQIFQDIGFKRSTHFRLSTSQVASKSDAFMVYGPVVPNGYGCCYNPRQKNINFGTSAFYSSESTNPKKFGETLECCLREMKDILVQAPECKM